MNKKITFSLIALILLVVILGTVIGVKDYKENTPIDTVSQNVESREKCIITIQEAEYDVTEFRSKHGGGDVFKCDTDMTKAFQGAHKGYLPMIEKLRVQ